jgi:hypothetical protein
VTWSQLYFAAAVAFLIAGDTFPAVLMIACSVICSEKKENRP